jgi:hypothetical protein
LPQEVFSAALPHGLYASGDFSAAENALGLRRITPYNFLLLRPHPAVDTDAGGIYCAPRALPRCRTGRVSRFRNSCSTSNTRPAVAQSKRDSCWNSSPTSCPMLRVPSE